MSDKNAGSNSEELQEQGVFERLISGPATARLLDFFVTYKDFDYSETDIAELADVSPKTVIKELAKFELTGLVKFTRNVGRAKMYRLDVNSQTAKALQQLAFALAEKDIENIDPLQQRLTEVRHPDHTFITYP
jgi:MarR-like DNA-binding transcriptional regulator SgrR of sgrS sRNA